MDILSVIINSNHLRLQRWEVARGMLFVTIYSKNGNIKALKNKAAKHFYIKQFPSNPPEYILRFERKTPKF